MMNLNIIHKIKHRVHAATYNSALYRWTLNGTVPEHLIVKPADPWPGDAAAGRFLCNGIFTLHGEQFPVAQGDWAPSGCSAVWTAHIHGFEWLRDLRALGGDAARRQARMMIESWIEQCGHWHDSAWDAAITGRRMAQWIALYDFYAGSADEDFQSLVLESLVRQGRHLSRVLMGRGVEGVGAFHAMKGLAYAGLGFEGHENWLEQALDMLDRELPRQILSDGGHVSRSPIVLLDVLRILIDLRGALRAGGFPVPDDIQPTIDRASQALRFMRYSDKGFGLFNGAQEGDVALVDAVLMQSNARGKILRSLPDTGFERASIGRSVLMVDAGRVPPYPHDVDAHAAPLSFEFCYGRERIFVACGSNPVDDEWRNMLRGTAAHNSVTLDWRNAAEIRKDGHFGRRPRSVVVNRQDSADACLIDAVHDGYVPLNGVSHRRRLYLSEQGHDLRGEETLTCATNLTREIGVVARFHLHPRVTVSLTKDGTEALLRLPGGAGWSFVQSGGVLSLENSIYMGQGCRPRKTKQLVITTTMDSDLAQIKWALQREGA